MARLLLVDDNRELLEIQSEFLREYGFEVVTAENGIIASELLCDMEFDLIVTDIIMPKKEGMEMISDLRKMRPGLPIIAVSGGGRRGATEYLPMARALGAKATLTKPFSPSALLAEVTRLLGA